MYVLIDEGDPHDWHYHEWRRLRLLILERDRYTCKINDPGCTRVATQVDHVRALADGGDMWDPSNLREACRHCNETRGADLGNRRKRIRRMYADRFSYRAPNPPMTTRF